MTIKDSSLTQGQNWQNVHSRIKRLGLGSLVAILGTSMLLVTGCTSLPSVSEIEQDKAGWTWKKPVPKGFHRIESGETVISISKKYKVKPADIVSWNNLQKPYYLYIGRVLRVQDASTALTTGKNSRFGPKWSWPVVGQVKKTYSAEKPEFYGLLLETHPDDKVRSAAAGVVVYADDAIKDYGNKLGRQFVIIRHAKNFQTIYGCDCRLRVSKAQQVKRGEPIAEVEQAQKAGNQVFFEMRQGDFVVNPLEFLATRP